MAAKRKAISRASPSRKKTSGTESTRSKPAVKATARPARRSRDKSNLICPMVGIGGSAGGFEATMELLRHLPTKNGTAFVVVQHLDPHHASKLASLLAGQFTGMMRIEMLDNYERRS